MARTQLNGLQWSSVQKTTGFNTLSPLTTKGDLVVFDGTNNIRFPVSASNYRLLSTDSTTVEGLIYRTNGQSINPENEFFIYEEFNAGTIIGNNNFISVTSGAGAVTTIVTTFDDTNHIGCVQLATGTTATGRDTLTSSNTSFPIVFSGGEVVFQALINIPTLSTGTQRYSLRIGFGDNTAAGDMVDGVYIEYDVSLSTAWRYKTSSNSTRTANNSAVTVATGWSELRIVVNTSGTSTEFFVNQTSLGTITTNIPITTAGATGIVCKIEKSVGNTSRIIICDYIYANKVFSTTR